MSKLRIFFSYRENPYRECFPQHDIQTASSLSENGQKVTFEIFEKDDDFNIVDTVDYELSCLNDFFQIPKNNYANCHDIDEMDGNIVLSLKGVEDSEKNIANIGSFKIQKNKSVTLKIYRETNEHQEYSLDASWLLVPFLTLEKIFLGENTSLSPYHACYTDTKKISQTLIDTEKESYHHYFSVIGFGKIPRYMTLHNPKINSIITLGESINKRDNQSLTYYADSIDPPKNPCFYATFPINVNNKENIFSIKIFDTIEDLKKETLRRIRERQDRLHYTEHDLLTIVQKLTQDFYPNLIKSSKNDIQTLQKASDDYLKAGTIQEKILFNLNNHLK